MELSEDLWESPVTVGNATGRAFTGLHGEGLLNASGDADTSNWPGTGATGSGFRSGDWFDATSFARVSDRYFAAYTSSVRYYSYGARCARTSP